jgi:hypothetical protein
MSQPIKIVEYFNQSPGKNISKFEPSHSNQKNNNSNFSPHQSNLIYNSNLSSSLNKNTEISSPSYLSPFCKETSPKIKDNKTPEDESTMNLNEMNIKKTRFNTSNSIVGEEISEKKNIDFPEARPCFMSLEFHANQNKSLNLNYKENDNIFKNNLNEEIKNNKSLFNFNNCPNCPNQNKKFRFNEIRNYFQELKELSNKMVETLELIYSKNEFLLNSSNEIELIDSHNQKYINVNNKKMNNKDIKININYLNKSKDSKDAKSNINNIPSPKLNAFFNRKENKEKLLLDNSKKNIILDQINQDIREEKYIDNTNNTNNTNSAIHNKMKSLKRINSRKFNIKARGIRYNILPEEMKKQLLSDAKNMRTAEVAKKYGISTRNVNRWKKKGIQRKKGSGRKFKDPRLERKILEWYKMQDKETLTSRQFKEKAIELSDNKTFRASSGWLTNMKRKYNLHFKKY